jgi:hypothetical protein
MPTVILTPWQHAECFCRWPDLFDSKSPAPAPTQNQSGTCNNQYMVVDLKRFRPRQVLPLPASRAIATACFAGNHHELHGMNMSVHELPIGAGSISSSMIVALMPLLT